MTDKRQWCPTCTGIDGFHFAYRHEYLAEPYLGGSTVNEDTAARDDAARLAEIRARYQAARPDLGKWKSKAVREFDRNSPADIAFMLDLLDARAVPAPQLDVPSMALAWLREQSGRGDVYHDDPVAAYGAGYQAGREAAVPAPAAPSPVGSVAEAREALTLWTSGPGERDRAFARDIDALIAAVRADVSAIPEALLAPNPEPPRLNSYYFSFDATGIGIIDRILQAVRDAGKAYHHTEGWMDDEGGKKTEADKIQDAANEAAAALRAAIHQQGGQP